MEIGLRALHVEIGITSYTRGFITGTMSILALVLEDILDVMIDNRALCVISFSPTSKPPVCDPCKKKQTVNALRLYSTPIHEAKRHRTRTPDLVPLSHPSPNRLQLLLLRLPLLPRHTSTTSTILFPRPRKIPPTPNPLLTTLLPRNLPLSLPLP